MTLQEYREMRQKVREKERDLATAIEEDGQQLSEMEQAYKEALAHDQEKKADELFPQIEETKKRLASNKQKQKTLKEVNADRIRNGAKEAAAEIFSIKREAEKQSGEVLAEVDELLTTLGQKVETLKEISQTYGEQRQDRKDVVYEFDMGMKELGQALAMELDRSELSNAVNPWRGMSGYRNDMAAMIGKYLQAHHREQRKQERKGAKA